MSKKITLTCDYCNENFERDAWRPVYDHVFCCREHAMLWAQDHNRRQPIRNTYSTSELLDDAKRVSETLGHIPSWGEYAKHGNYCAGTVRYRFGSWEGVKRALGWEPPIYDWDINSLGAADGGWLAGIWAGEGCFTMIPVSGSNRSRFTISAQISFREDNRIVLEEIKRLWQLNEKINRHARPGRRSPTVQLQITSVYSQYYKILPTFRTYSLRGCKTRDFELFAQAVELIFWRIGQGRFYRPYTDEERTKLKALYHQLQEVKRYNGLKKGRG